MMFALLQEQNHSPLEAMAAANKAAMEAIIERMNALVTAQGGTRRHQVVDTPPLTNGGKEDDPRKGQTRRMKALCPHCKALVYHKPEKCYELEANKDKRWPGWKSIKEMMAGIFDTGATSGERKDFYLKTPMARYKYMRLKISDMPNDVIEHYNLRASGDCDPRRLHIL